MNTNSRNSKHAGLLLLALLLVTMLAACSGKVDVAINGINIPPGTIPPFQNYEPVTAQGTVSGFGDLAVNDVRYDADGASITIDSQPGLLSDLRLGHVVTVTGRINALGFTGQATNIRMDSRIIGPVEAIDADNARLTVMGQTIRLGPETHYPATIDPATLTGLAPGERVRISGYVDAAGAIRATRVEPADANAPLQIIGDVSGLDIANLVFEINGLTVDYGSTVLIGLPGGAPADGMMVKVIGTLSNGLFEAEQLLTAPALTGASGRRAQLGGLITRFASPADFEVNDTEIAANAATAYSNGDSGDLALNAAVTIDGEFRTGGRILANRITFGQLAGNTTSLTYALDGFTEISVPTVFGITVTQGDEYSVEVIVDEEAANRIQVSSNGPRLTIALEPGNGHIDTLDAYITMPVLDRIDLTGVVYARLRNFDQPQMTMNVGGVSYLVGDGLRIGHLLATVSGVSRLDLGEIRPIGRADIDVGGVSQATLNMDVGSTLSGAVSTGQGTGTSALFYYGTGVTINVTAGWNAAVIWLGGTKP